MKCLVGLAIVLLFAVIANVNAQGGGRMGRPGRCASPMCDVHCPNGFVINRRGCPICRCRPFRSPIRPPRDCGPVCAIFCPYGNVPDRRGCPTCRCREGSPMSPRCPGGSTPMGGRRCSPMFGRNECGRGGFCHSTSIGSSWGICCRRRRISPRPWQSPRPRPFPRPILGYSRRDED